MIKSALMNFISTELGLSRVWGIAAQPNEPAPYAVVTLESVHRDRYHGAAGISTGLKFFDFEVSAYGENSAQAINLAQQIINLLENYSGPMVSLGSPATTYHAQAIEITSEFDDYDHSVQLYYYSVFITVPH